MSAAWAVLATEATPDVIIGRSTRPTCARCRRPLPADNGSCSLCSSHPNEPFVHAELQIAFEGALSDFESKMGAACTLTPAHQMSLRNSLSPGVLRSPNAASQPSTMATFSSSPSQCRSGGASRTHSATPSSCNTPDVPRPLPTGAEPPGTMSLETWSLPVPRKPICNNDAGVGRGEQAPPSSVCSPKRSSPLRPRDGQTPSPLLDGDTDLPMILDGDTGDARTNGYYQRPAVRRGLGLNGHGPQQPVDVIPTEPSPLDLIDAPADSAMPPRRASSVLFWELASSD